jgi:integrase
MTRPWKHPKTGVYWLRRGVPEDLRALVGKREEKRSLGTKDPVEAKRLHAIALAELDKRWASLRAGPCSLTERQAHEMAAVLHDRWVDMHREEPTQQAFWPVRLGDKLFAPPKPFDLSKLGTPDIWTFDPDWYDVDRLETWCLQQSEGCLAAHGLIVDEEDRKKLARAIAAAVQRASLALDRMAKGEIGPTPHPGLYPPSSQRNDARAGIGKPVRFGELVEGWAAETKPVPKTLYEWRRVLNQLATFLGHDDAGRLTADDLVSWKLQMIEAGLHGKTIRDGKIAPVRAILRWAVDNRRLTSNPAERITVDVKVEAGTKKRSFNDQEAATVLKAARREINPARRWVPWVCAYSGARLSEVCQLRKEDIVQIDQLWCMRLVPEAGSLKTANAERTVPLHPALIEEGFLGFVETVRSGPLFAALRPDKFGRRGGTGTKQLGRWVRSLGIVDERIQPNHSWRHRMRTLGRRYGLAPDIVDALVGHARRTVADRYGEFEVAALYRELTRIPTLTLAK